MADTQTKDLENTILMELKDGTVTIELCQMWRRYIVSG